MGWKGVLSGWGEGLAVCVGGLWCCVGLANTTSSGAARVHTLTTTHTHTHAPNLALAMCLLLPNPPTRPPPSSPMNPAVPDLECCICLDAYESPVMTPCHHWFCKECILGVLSGNTHCPLCRGPVTPADLRAPGKKPPAGGRAILDSLWLAASTLCVLLWYSMCVSGFPADELEFELECC
jgi:hypothetical protein